MTRGGRDGVRGKGSCGTKLMKLKVSRGSRGGVLAFGASAKVRKSRTPWCDLSAGRGTAPLKVDEAWRRKESVIRLANHLGSYKSRGVCQQAALGLRRLHESRQTLDE